MKVIRLYTYYILFMGMMIGVAGVAAYSMANNIQHINQSTYNVLDRCSE